MIKNIYLTLGMLLIGLPIVAAIGGLLGEFAWVQWIKAQSAFFYSLGGALVIYSFIRNAKLLIIALFAIYIVLALMGVA